MLEEEDWEEVDFPALLREDSPVDSDYEEIIFN